MTPRPELKSKLESITNGNTGPSNSLKTSALPQAVTYAEHQNIGAIVLDQGHFYSATKVKELKGINSF